MKFEIVSPTRVLFSGEADEVVLPTAMGEIGVLPGHARLLSITVPGSVQIRQGGQSGLLDLKGHGERAINRVELTYRAKPNFKGSATVCASGLT